MKIINIFEPAKTSTGEFYTRPVKLKTETRVLLKKVVRFLINREGKPLCISVYEGVAELQYINSSCKLTGYFRLDLNTKIGYDCPGNGQQYQF